MTKKQAQKIISKLVDSYIELIYNEAEENDHAAFMPGRLEEIKQAKQILTEKGGDKLCTSE